MKKYNDSEKVTLIDTGLICPSPYQCRMNFNSLSLKELSESIKTQGLIQPIVVRPLNDTFELVCGDRRLRASIMAGMRKIISIVRHYDDKQARLVCLSENVQRSDLTKIEEIDAVAKYIDAVMDAEFPEYRAFLEKKVSEPKGRRFEIRSSDPDLGNPLHRVAMLLGAVRADQANKTKHMDKFVHKLAKAFKSLNKNIEPETFARHDLPLLVKLEEYEWIKQVSVEKNLSKEQTKAAVELASKNEGLARRVITEGIQTIDGSTPVEDLSAREIRATGFIGSAILVKKFTGDQESYTPEIYIKSARKVMGSIDLDPASCPKAQETVRADKYFSLKDDGLKQEWHGRIFLNPPYSHPEIAHFIRKLIADFKSGNVKEAILLTNDNTDTEWFQTAARVASVVCFVSDRINFDKPDGGTSAPTNGQSFFFFGRDESKFIREFSQYGLLMREI
jgi:ParB-like chromosome segregation protein Spo0J